MAKESVKWCVWGEKYGASGVWRWGKDENVWCALDIKSTYHWQRWRTKDKLLKRFSLAKSVCSCFICLSKQRLYECENNFSEKLFFLSDVFLCYLSLNYSFIH